MCLYCVWGKRRGVGEVEQTADTEKESWGGGGCVDWASKLSHTGALMLFTVLPIKPVVAQLM